MGAPLEAVAGETHSAPQPIFIVWKAYQRRVDALQDRLEASPTYLHFAWEEQSKAHKALSYVCKFCLTLWVLFRRRPGLVFVQAPPILAVYAAWLYGRICGVPYVVDAHNTMIYDTFWPRLPGAMAALRHAATVLVHNKYVEELALAMELPCAVLMDRPPRIRPGEFSLPLAIVGDRRAPRVVVPCSYDVDEPLTELQAATRALPHVDFFITWYRDKLPRQFAQGCGSNVFFTGFLPIDQFNSLLACADVLLVLTTRDGTQPSGATEALSFERPLVVSDSPTIRALFPRGAIYVDNRAAAIADGIRTALDEKTRLSREMASFKAEKESLWEQQFQGLKLRLAPLTAGPR